MCGIIGVVKSTDTDSDEPALRAGLKTLSARGPDQEGLARFRRCILGHRRLSIVDLATGGQPMTDGSGNFTIVFNGEIYGYRELRERLIEKGHTFKTQSDTEVILEAYKAYGAACASHLDGMFAFAIWDHREETLFLARDRFGEKPLFFTTNGTAFAFASETAALFKSGYARAGIDPLALSAYLSLSFIPPWRSFYAHVHPLPPAHTALYKNGTLSLTRYWELPERPVHLPFLDAAAQVRELLTDSVKHQLIADVPVGSLLSGGIDSGIVTTLASGTSHEKRLKTFSVGFPESTNELPYARERAQELGTEHFEGSIDSPLPQTIDRICAYLSQPLADSSVIPLSLLSRFVRSQVTVALTGDGGDELFYGYGHYRPFAALHPLRRRLHRVFDDPYRRYANTLSRHHFDNAERHTLIHAPFHAEEDVLSRVDLSAARTPLQKVNLADFYLRLPGDMLFKSDQASMMHSLELRSPFLSHRLAEFAFNLPDSYKTSDTGGKRILAAAFGDLLPPEFFTRKKQGFGAPVSAWLMRPPMRAFVDESLSSEALVNAYLDTGTVRAYVEAFYAGKERFGRRVFTLLMLERFLRAHSEHLTSL